MIANKSILPPKQCYVIFLVIACLRVLRGTNQLASFSLVSFDWDTNMNASKIRVTNKMTFQQAISLLHNKMDYRTNRTIRLPAHSLEYYRSMPNKTNVTVEQNDTIHRYRWTSPYVIRSHKLIFFSVPKNGCTAWKMLFRRMMGYEDWSTRMPHDEQTNGLLHMSDISIEEATSIMNSPNWTRAIFLRDPKERYLSAYLDKAHRKDGGLLKNFNGIKGSFFNVCKEHIPMYLNSSQTLQDFLYFTERCSDGHWNPQFEVMEEKYWSTIDFVGHLETADVDAKALLQRIGAWEEFGASGWGNDGTGTFPSKKLDLGKNKTHYRRTSEKLAQFFSPQIESLVEERYAMDYAFFGFENQKLSLNQT